MPIVTKDYHWSQSEDVVFLSIPLRGVKNSSVNIICSNEYLKVSFSPFIFEVLLLEPIDDVKSTVKIKDGCIIFQLIKQEKRLWDKLESKYFENKTYVAEKRQEAIEYSQKKSALLQSEKASVREKTKKVSLKEMMKLEEQASSKIEEAKESERIQMIAEMDEWKERKKREAEAEKQKLLQSRHEENIFHTTNKLDNKHFDNEKKEKQLNDNDPDKTVSVSKTKTKKSDSKMIFQTQPSGPRKSGKIDVNFTPRVFPTPQRESKTSEEIEWLQKQASARKQFEIDEPDLAKHEKDPVWLKDKGNQLYSSENYLGAVNAFNLAIKVQPGMPILYLNRAACHLKLKNLYKCVEDCSTALDIMVPKVQSNARGRLKGHLRRATAFCKLELYAEALQDYEAALIIEPNNQNLMEDASKLRFLIQNK